MIYWISIITTVLCIILIIGLIQGKWSRWFRLSLIFLLFALLRDVSVGPLTRIIYDQSYTTRLISVKATFDEIPRTQIINLLGYASLASGILLAYWRIGNRAFIDRSVVELSNHYVNRRVWNASLLFFVLGLLSNAYVLSQLLASRTFLDLVRERAVFYDEAVIYTSLFNYARMFSPAMVVGAWGMIFSSRARSAQRWLSIMGTILYIGFQVLYAGRMTVFTALFGTALLWHFGVRRLKMKQIFAIVTAVGISLSLIYMLRLDFARSRPIDAFNGLIQDAMLSRTTDETAFAVNFFPASIPYLGWGPILDGLLMRPFPVLDIPGVMGTWRAIVEFVYYGSNPSAGVGGEHYSFVPEHYMYFGLSGVIFLGLFFGLVYGSLFAYADRSPDKPFLMIFVCFAMMAFVGSLIDGRMSVRLGNLAMSALLPLGAIIALSGIMKREWIMVWGPIYLLPICYMLNRLVNTRFFDYPFAGALLLAYINSMRAIGKSTKITVGPALRPDVRDESLIVGRHSLRLKGRT